MNLMIKSSAGVFFALTATLVVPTTEVSAASMGDADWMPPVEGLVDPLLAEDLPAPWDQYLYICDDGDAPDTLAGDDISGMDTRSLWFFYNPALDALYVGYETWFDEGSQRYTILGDTDGDGDPSNSSDISIKDYAGFANYESYSLMVDGDGDLVYNGGKDFTFGKPGLYNTTWSNFLATHGCVNDASEGCFGASLPDSFYHGVELSPVPSSANPHIELVLGGFGELLGSDPNEDALSFMAWAFTGLTANTGSVGEDYIPEPVSFGRSGGCMPSFPSPVGSVELSLSLHSGDVANLRSFDPGAHPPTLSATVAGCDALHSGSASPAAGGDIGGLALCDEYELSAAVGEGYVLASPQRGFPIGVQERVSQAFVAQLVDSDSDGLADLDEQALGTNPLDPDTDGDCLQDGAELLLRGGDVMSTTGAAFVPAGEGAQATLPGEADGEGPGGIHYVTAGTEERGGDVACLPFPGRLTVSASVNQSEAAHVALWDIAEAQAGAMITGCGVTHTVSLYAQASSVEVALPPCSSYHVEIVPMLGLTAGIDAVNVALPSEGDAQASFTLRFADSDDDGIADLEEDLTDGLSADDPDSDGDCLQDGAERGLTASPFADTDLAYFVGMRAGANPSDPVVAEAHAVTDDEDPDQGGDVLCEVLVEATPEAPPTEPVTPTPTEPVTPTPTEPVTLTPTPTPSDPTPIAAGMLRGGGGYAGAGCSTADSGRGGSAAGMLLMALMAGWVRRRRGVAAAVSVAGAAMVPAAAHAQEASVEVQRFHPVEDNAGSITTAGATTMKRGDMAFNVWANYAANPLVFVDGEGLLDPVITSALGVDLQGAFGLTDSLSLGATLPMTAYAASSDSSPFAPDSPTAFNDASVRLRWRLSDPSSRLGLALEPRLWIPTGSAANLTGGLWSAGLMANLDAKVGAGWVGMNLGYRARPEAQTLGNLVVDDEVLAAIGVRIPTGPVDITLDLSGGASVASRAALEGAAARVDVNAASRRIAVSPAEALVGVSRTTRSGLRIKGAVGMGVLAGYGAPDMRTAVSVGWGKGGVADTDGDGYIDSEDACPHEREDFDDFEDDDGCPDVDNDQDGILDVDDSCPMTPEDFDGFEDEDGCPEADNDRDGYLDPDDACPNHPEDFDGFEDEDGCPDRDNDQDGILDEGDSCPMIPEDFDGFEDEDGCPDRDNDQDTFLDEDDACPMRPERFNDFEDDDGCPDVKVTTTDIEYSEGRLHTLWPIHFEYDKATIMVESYAILDSMVQVFKDNPDMRVRIEGHTDWDGSDAYNLDLSDRRAKAVKAYMVGRGGLDSGRFETVGFGESVPVESNLTDEGRALNRRIEWVELID